MEIRIEGVLKSWDKARGFGFITPISGGGQDIFVHVSDFACKGGVPRPGERLTFEIGVNAEGKKKALRVRRPGQRAAGGARKAPQPRASWAGSWLGRLALLAGVVAIGALGHRFAPPLLAMMQASSRPAPQAQMPRETRPAPAVEVSQAPPVPQAAMSGTPSRPAASMYRCDGRTHCSQMNSCDEATYFLRNCPGTQMDGDGDGIPCERQLCD
jgi:cold shock CspA family protein